MKKILIIITLFFLLGCTRKETLDEYYGWKVIDKTHNWTLQLTLKKGDKVKTINTYTYYYLEYNLGDVIKKEKHENL